MKRILVILVIATLVGVFGCAKDPVLPTDEMKQTSFAQWMERHAPNAIPLPANDDVYIDFVYRNPVPWPDSLVPRLYSWFFVDYTGYTFDGKIFVTRQPAVSRKVGQWSPRTHFVDEFSQWYPDGGIWCQGLLEAFSVMHYMDSARIYIAANMGYKKDSMVRNSGTKGETSKYTKVPVYFDVRFKESINYPSTWWRDSLIRFVEKEWGQKAEDSIFSGCYMRKIKENPNGYQIDTDSMVYVSYKHNFCDGHFISTIDDSVAYAEGYTGEHVDEESTGIITIQVGSDADAYMDLYDRVLPYMRKGEVAEFALIAGWSPYGQAGNPNGIPQIFPWENTIVTMYTYPDSIGDDINDDVSL